MEGYTAVIEDIEYISLGWISVTEFQVGDRLGSDRYLITASESAGHGDWKLVWVKRDGDLHTYVGRAGDERWVPTAPKDIVIEEEDDVA